MNSQSKKISKWDLVRKNSKLFSNQQEYLLGIPIEKLYGGAFRISGNKDSHVPKNDVFESFESEFKPEEMRCLALVAHNHMKPAMKTFVEYRKELLKKFRLTGTNTTMTMLKSVFGDDPNVVYGPSFKSGPLGGDAEVCALMCQEDLGGVLFFMDPLQSHPHQCDIEALIRLSNVQNVMLSTNPTSSHALCYVLELALKEGRREMIPSFFHTLESPGVKVYNEGQKKVVQTVDSQTK